MKNVLRLGLVAAAGLALSGCLTASVVKDLTPEAKKELALKFLDRCGGTVNIGAGGGSGQIGGGFQANFQLTGTCPTPEAPRIVPLAELGKPIAAPLLTDETRAAFNAWLAERLAPPT